LVLHTPSVSAYESKEPSRCRIVMLAYCTFGNASTAARVILPNDVSRSQSSVA
jgi:hypothetical protein